MTKAAEKPARGRPPLPEGEVLTEILQVRVNEQEADMIISALDQEAGETVSGVGRKLLVAWAKRRKAG